MPPRRTVVLAALALLSPAAAARPAPAQVAFQPVVGAFPSGVTMSATPVVSADRRYVRMGVTPQFSALQGFDTYSVPAAVSGGPGGPGALRSVGVGATFDAGLNGVVGGDDTFDDGPGRGFNPAGVVSPDAAAFLAGGFGISPRPRLSGSLVEPPRPKASRKAAKPKGVRPTRPRAGAGGR